MSTNSSGFYTNGFYVGSDPSGYEQCRGAIWSFVTWTARYGAYYTNSWAALSNDLAAWQASPGGGFGGMMGSPSGAMGKSGGPSYVIPATNYIDYNQFWVMTSLTNRTNVLVTITNTLSNLTYTILTNSALGSNAPPWGLFATLTATNSSVAASNAVPLGTSPLFVQAGLVWNTSTNNSPLPDWLSMSLYGRLSIPTVGGYITNGLAAYWKMNETNGSIAHDSSGNGLYLPLSNSPSWGSNYMILNGSTQYGDAGSNALTTLDNHDITICAWIYADSTSAQGIVDKDYYAARGDYGGWCFLLDNGQLSWSVENGPNLADTGAATVPLGQWTFVAVTWSYPNGQDNLVSYYINGILNSSVGAGSAIEKPSGSAHLAVGNIRNNESNGLFSFDGYMHDVAIYSRALTSWEIAFNFLSSEFATNVPNPDLLCYKMTETNETSVPIYLTNSSNPTGLTGLYPSNASVIWTNGPGGEYNALHFDGVSSFLDTGLSNTFNFTSNPFTINLWLLSLGPTNFVMGNNTYATDGWFMAVNAFLLLFGAETADGEAVVYTKNTVSGWPTAWNMITITRDGANALLIYINGLQQFTGGQFLNPISTANTLKFGAGVFNNGSFVESDKMDGTLWLPQIWSTNLSSADIANLYYNQLRGKPWP